MERSGKKQKETESSGKCSPFSLAFPCFPLPSVTFRFFHSRKGQATTETVLLFPIFMFFLFVFAKIFAMLILVQKMEIASYYGARRWQLESHRNETVFSDNGLQSDIQQKVSSYLGYGSPSQSFLGLAPTGSNGGASFQCTPTEFWQVCTLKVKTQPIDIAWMYQSPGYTFEVTKYVPHRDRPIPFVLPGMGP